MHLRGTIRLPAKGLRPSAHPLFISLLVHASAVRLSVLGRVCERRPRTSDRKPPGLLYLPSCVTDPTIAERPWSIGQDARESLSSWCYSA